MKMAHARRYYRLTTSSADTNLQLYALKQAKRQWQELCNDISGGLQVDHFHERCIFLICTIGLSVSQLLGQNNPVIGEKVPSPKVIFNSIVDEYGLHSDLKYRFGAFVDEYDRCRHFGVTEGGVRHWEVSQITLERTKDLYEFGMLVWSVVIEVYRRGVESDMDDLDLSCFEDDY